MKKFLLAVFIAVIGSGALAAGYVMHVSPSRSLPPDSASDTDLHFLVMGDQGSGKPRQWRVANAMSAVATSGEPLNFVATVGDNFYMRGVSSVSDPQWNWKFEHVYRGDGLNVPFFAVLGNHDYMGDPQAQIEYTRAGAGSGRWQMPDRQYVRDFGDHRGEPLLRVVFVDTNGDPATAADFVDRASGLYGNPRWRIVVGHHPMRNYGKYGANEALLKTLLPALQRFRADVYFSGHDHNIQLIARPGEPVHVISGAAGKRVYRNIDTQQDDLLFSSTDSGFHQVRLDADTLVLTAIAADSRVLDVRTLKRQCGSDKMFCITSTDGATP